MRITSPYNIKNDSRPISKHVDDNRIDIFIKESELLNIKPRIGDELYIDLTNFINSDSIDKLKFPHEYYEKLLSGGEYLTSDGSKKYFAGLIECLNYYVYARLIANNSETVTRFGFVEKNDEYSSNVELKKQLKSEKDVLQIADMYISDCLDYLKENYKNIPKFKQGKQKNRLRISIIGN